MTLRLKYPTFYLGAATTGEGDGKWSWPGRDLPFLYKAERKEYLESSLYPDYGTWKEYGLVKFFCQDSDTWRLATIKDLENVIGKDEVIKNLQKSVGTYLKESKDKVLTGLGCP